MPSSISTITALFEHVAAKDLDGVVGFFAEDSVFVDCSDPVVAQGPGAIRDWLVETWNGLPDFHIGTVVNIVGDDTRVLVEVELVGIHQGEFLGYPPTGSAIRWAAAIAYELDPETMKIKREAYYYDPARLLAQLH